MVESPMGLTKMLNVSDRNELVIAEVRPFDRSGKGQISHGYVYRSGFLRSGHC